ncbi:MAG: membrane protein insertion efficiency factor YidD [Bacilli bacterium]|nr:membrane protein insertion efficiency factor YidD [Bacilli bacterium]
MKYVMIGLIRLYQKIPGPWHNYCKYKPTCSNYAIGVFREFGFFKGFYLMTRRLVKCNCFSKGGYDPIPFRKK